MEDLGVASLDSLFRLGYHFAHGTHELITPFFVPRMLKGSGWDRGKAVKTG